MQTLNISRQDAQAELTDFVRTRTELECIIEDLRTAGLRAGGKREELEAELSQVDDKIAEREANLEDLIPDWEAQRAQEVAEKRKLDEAALKLGSLFAKQGRASKFRTKADRDRYLRHEIASMDQYETTQRAALAATRTELANAQHAQGEIETQIAGVHGRIEDGRNRVKDLAEQAVTLKDQQSELIERRKELWREDTKLESMVSHAADQLRTAERLLAGMMDKVCVFAGIERHTCTNTSFRTLARDSKPSIRSLNGITWRVSTDLSIDCSTSRTRNSALLSN